MNINTDSMTEVADVNNTQRTADLQYSTKTERWVINNAVQRTLNLDKRNGFRMFTANNDDGERVIVLRIVDSEEADFFTGKTPNFTGRKMWTLVQNLMDGETQLSMVPINNRVNEFVLQPWAGESEITSVLDDISQNVEEPQGDGMVGESTEETEVEFSVNQSW